MRIYIGMFAIGFGLAVASEAFASPTSGYLWEVRDVNLVELPRLGGDQSEALDINNVGQIVGTSINQDGVWNSFLFQPSSGSIQNVGTAVMSEESAATGINDKAELVGYFIRNDRHRPFYWHQSVGFMKLDLEVNVGAAYNDQYSMLATAINQYGQIVGRALGDYGYYETDIPVDGCHWDIPLFWSSRIARPVLIKCSQEWYGSNGAWDISDSGWVAMNDSSSRRISWRHFLPTKANERVPDAVTNSLGDSIVGGVNEAGHVTGRASTTETYGPRQAYYWNGVSSKSKILGALGPGLESIGMEVNDQNFVTGRSEKQLHVNGAPFVGQRAFLWHADFGMYELPAFPNGESGWVSTCEAEALDNVSSAGRAGLRVRVVGFCTKNGKHRAVRWDVYLEEHRAPGTLQAAP